ncbi:MAG: GGDEF domain-containing protein [Pseudomonadales bacterium]|nr:GGDEF domain-containing protein [Pseudomonadales bacterium]
MLTDIEYDELERIITKRLLTPVFQVIVDTEESTIFGYEALIRGPADSPLHSPYNLFRVAHKVGRLSELELLCREISIDAYADLNLKGKICLNISPMSLMSESPIEQCAMEHSTLDLVTRRGIPAKNVVIEISELYPVEDLALFRKATLHYRSMGFEIAIDDLGSGYAGLKVWSELKPDYVKIDRHFISNIDQDRVKKEFVRSIKSISDHINCRVIAEGVETSEELNSVSDLNIHLAQGYLIEKPVPNPPKEFLHSISETLRKTPITAQRNQKTVHSLAQGATVLNKDISLEETAEIFSHKPHIHTLPVCIMEHPLGVVSRHRVQEIISARYSRELHGKKPIYQFLNPNSIIIEKECSLNHVSQLITENTNYDLSQDFIITDKGKYLGVGNPRELLKRITEQQLKSARYANPLTQLPGNVPIYEHMDLLLSEGEEFWVAYLDLNHFKPYNDVYGYSRGDEVIQCVARIAASQTHKDQDFLGHIGGDDFVIIFTRNSWKQRCETILKLFSEEVSNFYNLRDLNAGGFWSEDRNGKACFFSMLTLAIGVSHPCPKRCRSHHDIAALATASKHQAKRSPGNSLFYSRRRGPLSRIEDRHEKESQAV